ncbi:MAG: FRG domain-containing protein [Solirubrobacterales bacterium]
MALIDKISVKGASKVEAANKDGSVRHVIRVVDPNALTQVVGHARYQSNGSLILLRGHSELWPSIIPTLYRSHNGSRWRAKVTGQMADYVRELAGGACGCNGRTDKPECAAGWPCRDHSKASDTGVVRGTATAAIEPLLQHYGVRTRWVDVVDNIWIALWFACHELRVVGRYGHHARRDPNETYTPSAYITLLNAGACVPTGQPGISRSAVARVADLRTAVPSVYVRPHAQHGLLIAAGSWSTETPHDLVHLEELVIEIPLRSALDWLGGGISLTPYVLFPPADHDEGFRRLLEFAPDPPTNLGGFTVFGPGW